MIMWLHTYWFPKGNPSDHFVVLFQKEALMLASRINENQLCHQTVFAILVCGYQGIN